MIVYPKVHPSPALWPEPLEVVLQSLPSGPGTAPALKLPHISTWEALILGALPLMPRESRPMGSSPGRQRCLPFPVPVFMRWANG